MSTNGDAPLLEIEGLVTRFPLPRGVVGTLGRQPRRAVRAVPRAFRAFRGARAMTAKWPFFGYTQHLGTPIAELRRRYGVRLV